MQDLRSAIGVEARTTFFNPRYIREQMKGGASAAAGFAELVENTYGWNVMKPSVIDNRMWEQIYEVYVKDVNGLGIRNFFENESLAALQEITAVMQNLNALITLHMLFTLGFAAAKMQKVFELKQRVFYRIWEYIPALMVALVFKFNMTEIFSQEDYTIVKNPGKENMEIIIKEGQAVNKYKPSEKQDEKGKMGKKVGVAYQLENGEIIYVPE